MRKTLFFSGLFLILFAFNSCTTEYYNTMETVLVTIYERDWIQENTSSEEYFYYEIRINELTSSVFTNGNVDVFLHVGRDSAPNLYPLPDVKTWDDGEVIYTETVSYELISPSTIAFKVERNDLYSIRPGTMKFKVVITKPY